MGKSIEQLQEERAERANEGAGRLMKKCIRIAERYLKKLENPLDTTLPFEWKNKMDELRSYVALIQEGSSIWYGELGDKYQMLSSRLFCQFDNRRIDIR